MDNIEGLHDGVQPVTDKQTNKTSPELFGLPSHEVVAVLITREEAMQAAGTLFAEVQNPDVDQESLLPRVKDWLTVPRFAVLNADFKKRLLLYCRAWQKDISEDLKPFEDEDRMIYQYEMEKSLPPPSILFNANFKEPATQLFKLTEEMPRTVAMATYQALVELSDRVKHVEIRADEAVRQRKIRDYSEIVRASEVAHRMTETFQPEAEVARKLLAEIRRTKDTHLDKSKSTIKKSKPDDEVIWAALCRAREFLDEADVKTLEDWYHRHPVGRADNDEAERDDANNTK